MAAVMLMIHIAMCRQMTNTLCKFVCLHYYGTLIRYHAVRLVYEENESFLLQGGTEVNVEW